MKNRNWKLLISAAAVTVLSACGEQPAPVAEAPAEDKGALAIITLSNPSEFARKDQASVFGLDELGLSANVSYRVISGGDEV
ncbi:MAG: hypothetical protein KJP17_00835, partial [Gammaproteobacteria bacterium]|nr:hypothetical protein [Gammaproteobacteria bacterium]